MLGSESPGPADGAPIVMLLTPLACIGDLKSTLPRSQVAQHDEGPGKLKLTSCCVIVCRSYGLVAVPALFKSTPKVGRTARSALLAGRESGSTEGSQAPERMALPCAGLLECAVRISAAPSHAADLGSRFTQDARQHWCRPPDPPIFFTVSPRAEQRCPAESASSTQ